MTVKTRTTCLKATCPGEEKRLSAVVRGAIQVGIILLAAVLAVAVFVATRTVGARAADLVALMGNRPHSRRAY